MLWATAGVVCLGFLVALEVAARHYGLPGPMTTQVQEVVVAPKSGFLLYASLALTMVVLTWRQRFVALGVAAGIDLVFLLVRWTFDIGTGDGHPFGNGALWVILGCAVIALTRRTGSERVLLLKGVGLGLLLVAGRKTGDTWLLLTSETRRQVLDQYVATADQALGNPAWVAGRIIYATGPAGFRVLDFVYGQLAVAAVVFALYRLRHVAVERRFPTHHLVRTFLVIGLLGPAIYMIFPVVGPIYAYGGGSENWAPAGHWSQVPSVVHWAVADLWPQTPPPVQPPLPMPFDEITPRNCMPSLHTAWAVTIFVHSRKAPRVLRWAGAFWLVATLTATVGFGYHYGADLLAGVVFALTVEGALRAHDNGWDRSGIQLVSYGTAVFAAYLVSYRYLPLEMAEHPWVFGPLLVLAMVSVVYAYVRTTRRWDAEPVPARDAEARPAPDGPLVVVPAQKRTEKSEPVS
ncbi:phosphatase PAP2 family protein [Streptomyces sp. NPDC002328]|uniref:phosphatase PAP2 family protein n=1 Tax=Streptomyces sp. NPDC002328 TaxID=3364642 RepID=UPI0036C857B1